MHFTEHDCEQQHGYRRFRSWAQHHRLQKHGRRRSCAFIEHNRPWQHGHWLSSALSQHRVENNVGLGFNAGYKLTDGDGNICIGSNLFGVAGESNTTRIANIYFSLASGRPVYINSDGKLGRLSARDVSRGRQPMEKASEAILALKLG